MTGFKAFLMRGNLISLAVAVVIGTAFTAMVTAFVADLITPLIAAIVGKRSFPSLTFTINHSTFQYGLLINAVLSFLIITGVVYWLIVAPTVTLTARLTRKAEATTKDCPECLSTIPIAASRCMYCTVVLATTTTAQAPATAAATADHRASTEEHRQAQRRRVRKAVPACYARNTGNKKRLDSGRGLAVPSPDVLHSDLSSASVLIVWHCFLLGSCGNAANQLTGLKRPAHRSWRRQ